MERVREIKKYRFRKELISDPLLFSIPEMPDLLATQSMAPLIEQEGLRGFKFTDTDADD